MVTTTAYKLLRLGKDGNLHPLFIERNQTIPVGEWLQAEDNSTYATTHGFASRPGWHCCFKPIAPHLKTELASGEKRVWCEIEVDHSTIKTYPRPESQGGTWILAQRMRIVRTMSA